ncbi:MAG: flotillin family protein [Candidatus Kapabacteria bacterium]|nr:flotillin family protein [Candidatus Kapabacteria bacterium]
MNVLVTIGAVVLGILLLWLFHRLFFRLFGIVIVPEDKIGLVTKKFVLFGAHKQLPDGRIIAVNGEAGYQARPLAPGVYFWMWFWQYSIKLEPFTVIPEGKIGLIVAKDGAELETGRILARRVDCDAYQDAEGFIRNGGRKGRQTAYLTAGTYRINTYLFDIIVSDMTYIGENMVGIITTLDGNPIEEGAIAGKHVDGHNNFQNSDAFLDKGGNKGLQPQVILAGSYNLNPWFIQVEEIEMTEIPIGHVGVVISFVGQEGVDVSGTEFRHGNIVSKGQKGVWAEPLGPGKYPVNRYIQRIELVPTTNLVLNWAQARTEAHQLDKNLSTITVRSRDGFPFNLDVSQIIHIPSTEAPKVIARFGNMLNLVTQVLEPTIGNYFRNSAQEADVISFLSSRRERQDSAKQHISRVLDQYNVYAVDTLIGDIVPPESLMKTLTDRKIAEEQKVTFETQRQAQETRQNLEKETAIADIQGEIVKADQGVMIAKRIADASVEKANGEAQSVKIAANAEAQRTTVVAGAEAERTKLLANAEAEKVRALANAEAEKITVTGNAEAEKILAVGKSNAEAYRLQVDSMGGESFVRLKITEAIGANNIKVIPDVLVSGGGDSASGPLAGLLGLKLMEDMGKRGDTAPGV